MSGEATDGTTTTLEAPVGPTTTTPAPVTSTEEGPGTEDVPTDLPTGEDEYELP